MTYQARRRRRVWWLRAFLALLASGALAGFVAALPALSRLLGLGEPITAANINEFLVGLIPTGKLGKLLAGVLDAMLVRYPLPVTVLIGFGVGWLSTGALATRLHDHALSEFNDEVLTRVPRPRPFDPLRGAAGLSDDDVLLPWHLEPGTPRHALWDQAERLTREHLEQHPRREGWHRKPITPFGWSILLGRPGSGKSRLAVEYARHVAQRGRFGNDGNATCGMRLRTWWRVAVLGRPPANDDPWDAGWLSPGVGKVDGAAYPEHAERRSAHPVWLERLAIWRPRRPTLLLLDDPRPGDAREVIAVLERASEHYGHAVRLLIINQSAPAELGLRRQGQRWTAAGGMAPLVVPLVHLDEMRLREADIRRLRGTGAVAGRFPVATDPAVREFLRITRGNALLVELGLRWLRRGRTLEAMTEDALLTERVERILDALREAGLGEHEHWRAVAVATLAGGTEAESARAGAITREFPIPLKTPEELARIFPVDREADLRNILPPIRPELVGDAFVARVMGDAPEADQCRMLAAAWAANARGTLRSVLRRGGRDDDLGRLLRSGPPRAAGLDWLSVAQAYAETALWLAPSDLPESREAQETRLLVLAAATECGKLSPAQARVMLDWLLDLAGGPDEGRGLRLDAWFVLIGHALQGALSGEPQSTAMVTAVADRLFPIAQRRLGTGQLGVDARTILSACWRHAAASADWNAAGLLHLHCVAEGWRCRALSLTVAEGLSGWLIEEPTSRDGARRASASHVALAFLARSGHSAVCRLHAETVDHIAASFPADRDFQLQRAQAWASVAVATTADPEVCCGHAEAVDRIAAPFPADRDVQLQRAQAWASLAFATKAEPAVCRSHAEAVDRIAAPFPADRDFQLQRAQAWCRVAVATTADPAVCRGYGEAVDRIAARFPADRDFQFERAQAWASVVVATTADPAVCRGYAEAVDRIAAPFPADRGVQLQRAQAWASLAFATKAEPAVCRGHAEAVDRIAAPFPADRGVQRQRAVVWRFVTYAACVADADPTVCRGHAEAVDRIAAPFPADRDFQFQRAQAWCYLTGATETGPAVCRGHAEAVDRIAAPFPADRDFQLQRAQAWCCVARAAETDPAVCRGHAEAVDRIAARFDDEDGFQKARRLAWSYVRGDSLEGRLAASLRAGFGRTP